MRDLALPLPATPLDVTIVSSSGSGEVGAPEIKLLYR